jgi:hypothetical protein
MAADRSGARAACRRVASSCRANGWRIARPRIRRFSRSGGSPPTGFTVATLPCAGVIAGVGRVEGRDVHDRRQRRDGEGRDLFPLTVKKHLRAQEIAWENHLPCVYLVDSGGANLPNQDEVFPDRDHFGRIFFNQANMSAAGHSADRGGDGLVYRGRGLRAGDERRNGHRQETGHDLSGRPATGQGRHRRSRHGRGTRRRGCALPAVRGGRPLRRQRRHQALAWRSIVAI